MTPPQGPGLVTSIGLNPGLARPGWEWILLRRIPAKSSGRGSAWPVRLIEGCLSGEVFFRRRQTRPLGKILVSLPLIWFSTDRRLNGVEVSVWRNAGSQFRNCRGRARLAVSVPLGFEASHVPHVLEWACLTEGRLRCALSRSHTRNGRVRFLPLPVSSIPSFPAGQESLSLAVLHFVSSLRVRADRLRS